MIVYFLEFLLLQQNSWYYSYGTYHSFYEVLRLEVFKTNLPHQEKEVVQNYLQTPKVLDISLKIVVNEVILNGNHMQL